MGTKPEQIERGAAASKAGRVSWKSYVKKMTRKLHRRLAKRDPENAPTRPFYKGYEA